MSKKRKDLRAAEGVLFKVALKRTTSESLEILELTQHRFLADF